MGRVRGKNIKTHEIYRGLQIKRGRDKEMKSFK